VTTVATIFAKAALFLTAYYLAPFESGSDSVALRIVLALAIIVVTVVVSVRSILHTEFPLIRATDGVSTLVLLMLLSFASTYTIMSVADSTTFSEPLEHTSALYFSLTTSTTIGYGDISPKSDGARIAVMIHMLVNVLFVGVAVRLLFQTARRRVESM